MHPGKQNCLITYQIQTLPVQITEMPTHIELALLEDLGVQQDITGNLGGWGGFLLYELLTWPVNKT